MEEFWEFMKKRAVLSGRAAWRNPEMTLAILHTGTYIDHWAAKTETEAIDAALNLVVFEKEILKSLGKVAGKVVSKRCFSGKAPDGQDINSGLIQVKNIARSLLPVELRDKA
jgi:hypothetical protein